MTLLIFFFVEVMSCHCKFSLVSCLLFDWQPYSVHRKLSYWGELYSLTTDNSQKFADLDFGLNSSSQYSTCSPSLLLCRSLYISFSCNISSLISASYTLHFPKHPVLWPMSNMNLYFECKWKKEPFYHPAPWMQLWK